MQQLPQPIAISVVICTYNRADLLRLAMESILEQKVPSDSYELIIVDNNSTDNTREVVEQFSSRKTNIRYFFEDIQGLSYARNRGWYESRGIYVGYLDDDAKAPPNWLEVAQDICKNIHPAAFGGPFYGYYLSPKPDWYKDEYGSWIQGTRARRLTENETLVGGNMFIRRALLESLGGFDHNLGMRGILLGYCEETALIEKIRHQKEENVLYYDPRLYIEHFVRPEKMKWSRIIYQIYAGWRDYFKVYPSKNEPVSVIRLYYRIIKNIILFIVDIVFRVFYRDRTKYPRFQNYYYEHSTWYIRVIADLVEQARQKVPYVRK